MHQVQNISLELIGHSIDASKAKQNHEQICIGPLERQVIPETVCNDTNHKCCANNENMFNLRGRENADHILPMGEGKAWICSENTSYLVLYNQTGQILQTIQTTFPIYCFVFTPTGEIIATAYKNHCVKKIARNGKISYLPQTSNLHPTAILYNKDGQLVLGLSGYRNKIAIFEEEFKVNIREIEFNQDGEPIFDKVRKIVQNGNSDYIVANKYNVVCVDEFGTKRWIYNGRHKYSWNVALWALAVCCDSNHNVIVADFMNNYLDLLDSGGHFLRQIVPENTSLIGPLGLAMGGNGCLWVGYNHGNVMVKNIDQSIQKGDKLSFHDEFYI